MRKLVRLLLLAPPVTLAGLVAQVPAAVAAPQASVAEGTDFGVSRAITVTYTGMTTYQKLFVQQCAEGDGPRFDYSLACAADNTVVTPLLDAPDGKVTFRLFVGDEPSGQYQFACGPTSKPDHQAVATCYLRLVQASLDDYDHDLFLPVTFSAAGTSAPTSAAPATVVAGATPTTVGGASAGTTVVPRVVVTVVTKRKTNVTAALAVAFGIAGVGLLVGTLVTRRRQAAFARREVERRDPVARR